MVGNWQCQSIAATLLHAMLLASASLDCIPQCQNQNFCVHRPPVPPVGTLLAASTPRWLPETRPRILSKKKKEEEMQNKTPNKKKGDGEKA